MKGEIAMNPHLSENRLFERMIYSAPELTDEIKMTFLELDSMEQAILQMEQDANYHRHSIFCTPYVRTRDDSMWFVDIYDEDSFETYNCIYKTKALTRRIIIAPDYMLTEEDEYIIDCLDKADFVRFNERVAESFEEELSVVAPELHIKKYDSIVDVFRHAYYSSYKSGLRELLYKCNLM